MGKRSREYKEEVKEFVRQLLKNKPDTTLAEINRQLEANNLPFTYRPLIKVVNELKNEKPDTEQLPATSPADSTVEYDSNPDVAKLNASLAVLEQDFKNTKSGDERRKIMTAICLARESKLRMQKTLRETEAVNMVKEQKTIIIKFGEPSVLDVENCKKIFGEPKPKTVNSDVPQPTFNTIFKPQEPERPFVKCELCDNQAVCVRNTHNRPFAK